ncbi:DUF5777 family beta-barrel protein [Flavihumibacter rivuli]|uniref:DUF5777 family beta-barrel protein n=1 Tax=Flavihumibacter rivuli TaxID=2838156 RepID=UPI001EFBACCE|nr:DUF5777 family beta-barrel protein [Flavihumibacter rivuli]ULQ55127.1 DUF5777 family beta-barrel protein [Flavihumibacter rivuli]
MKLKSVIIASSLLACSSRAFTQDEDLLKLVGEEKPKKEKVSNAFKSSRVINGHSVEFIGVGVIDLRFLHRFGLVKDGFNDFFGLDQATMRFGLDYGITKDLTVGFGRSTYKKEWDGFIKYRVVQQSKGEAGFPVSIVVVSGMTMNTLEWADPDRKNYFSSRLGFYNQVLIGRKFTESFTLQLAPTFVHTNLVEKETDSNDAWALGIGTRLKLSKRVAFVVDYHYVFSGIDKTIYTNPLSVGVDIETGGHVFQLHFSNSTGMNERAFITETTGRWDKGEIRFGFNLSRVFNTGRARRAK